MKPVATAGLTALVISGLLGSLALADVASTERVVTGLSSNKARGTVSIAAEPVLDKGRLVLSVTGINRTDQPVGFTAGDIKVFTAAGKKVRLVELDDLIAEARREADNLHRPVRRERDPLDDHRADPMRGERSDPLDDAAAPSYGRRSTSTTRRTDPADDELGRDSDTTIGGVSTRQSPTGDEASASVEMGSLSDRAQVGALKAAILQATVVQPSGGGGGKIVTEKLRFGRKDERALRVQVNFAGEQHEFSFVPPES
jgi:hypothetical protein